MFTKFNAVVPLQLAQKQNTARAASYGCDLPINTLKCCTLISSTVLLPLPVSSVPTYL